ncbi:CHAT domain-containing protein [Dactylosporangium vinaceum]|uniref:CHAT domain-containing protein n=1 Tax=Dactylosporangium vinaceum TaxID=53362 RepID=A0ABV5MJU0_9ACTN|nr:CHAT domain-containing protein [Dactylosporangium vinaceum]UAB92685.1 CHAT domain-containing protein [Dactylosporangium vinaceum]
MIEVAVSPQEIVVGRSSALTLRFFNSGRAPCFNVEFMVRLPPGVMLQSGVGQVDIPVLGPGRVYTHTISVLTQKVGPFELTSARFAYRDESDRQRRVTDFSVRLVAAAAIKAEPVRLPRGRLRVECEDGELAAGQWGELRLRVGNGTGVALGDVIAAVDGPFETDGRRSRVAVLGDGASVRCTFSVKMDVAGRVPVDVRTTYRFRDAGGELRARTQEDSATVTVRPEGQAPHQTQQQAPPQTGQQTEGQTGQQAPPRAGRKSEQVVLYLAAAPRDMEPLRSDLEMRKVREKLQRSRDRERFRLEWCPAARFEDISQALIDYEPQIVHFSGHGDEDGNLCVEDELGDRDLVTPEGLADLFGQHRDSLRCVVVNACHSVQLAETLATRIQYTVGMRNMIADDASIQFSVGFYEGLFGGLPIPRAFTRGCAHVRSRPGTEHQHRTPLLFSRTS